MNCPWKKEKFIKINRVYKKVNTSLGIDSIETIEGKESLTHLTKAWATELPLKEWKVQKRTNNKLRQVSIWNRRNALSFFLSFLTFIGKTWNQFIAQRIRTKMKLYLRIYIYIYIYIYTHTFWESIFKDIWKLLNSS